MLFIHFVSQVTDKVTKNNDEKQSTILQFNVISEQFYSLRDLYIENRKYILNGNNRGGKLCIHVTTNHFICHLQPASIEGLRYKGFFCYRCSAKRKKTVEVYIYGSQDLRHARYNTIVHSSSVKYLHMCNRGFVEGLEGSGRRQGKGFCVLDGWTFDFKSREEPSRFNKNGYFASHVNLFVPRSPTAFTRDSLRTRR
ncbi:hypothetical protein V1477_007599 [Vespula maculifrons]|uniref:Uncharacterized protein n=1 Tax=Vespula maculifrons TaxID=7453 RepID=A0ABD2CGT7_VESMC